VESEAPEAPEAPPPLAADDLLPGTTRVFGLAMPQGSTQRFASPNLQVFHVPASMPRVMRYVERMLTVRAAEVMALGAMLRGARLREGSSHILLDVGVRDEGGVCTVTVWDRTPPEVPPLPPGGAGSPEVQRQQGIDPATGRPGRSVAY